MRWSPRIVYLSLLLLAPGASLAADCPETLDFTFRPLAESQPVRLCERYRGQVVLVVNTASKCVFTPQYEGLEALYRHYRDRGLVVIGFPSNDFAGQEPGTEQQIQSFCRLTYGVQFPMFEKIRVARRNAHPFYARLAEQAGGYPRWNFHKYLLDHRGQVVASYVSQIAPDSDVLRTDVERLLAQRAAAPDTGR